MLSWSKETLTFAPNDNVGQQEWQRKENLYQEVKAYFIPILSSSSIDDKILTLSQCIRFSDFEEFRQRKMLGERHSTMQGIGRFLRNKTIRLQSLERYTHNASSIHPKDFNTNSTRSGILPRLLLWHAFPVICSRKLMGYLLKSTPMKVNSEIQ